MSIRGSAAIVGTAEVDIWTSERSPLGLMVEASHRALADAGLAVSDVDGLFSASSYYAFPTMNLAAALGIGGRYEDSTNIGGASFVSHVGHAAAAIAAGLCEVALIAYGSTQRSDRGRLVSRSEWSVYEEPYGLIHPVSSIALMAQRHMYEFGTTSEQLAAAAVAARSWSLLTEDAPYGEPLTVEEVLGSRPLSSPLRARDCCLVTDGGGAIVVTSAERAADLRQPAVLVDGFSSAINHRHVSQLDTLTSTVAARTAREALAMADKTLADVDTAHVYDAFTASLMILLEDLGFCAKGDGGPYLGSGATGPGGELWLNTNGAGLGHTHPGMLGVFLITEAVAQLRGQAGRRQHPSAEVSLVHGMGMTLAAHSTLVLSRPR